MWIVAIAATIKLHMLKVWACKNLQARLGTLDRKLPLLLRAIAIARNTMH